MFPMGSCYVLSSLAWPCVLSQNVVCALALSHYGLAGAFNLTLIWLRFLKMVMAPFPSVVDFAIEYLEAERAKQPGCFSALEASASTAPFEHHCLRWGWVNALGMPCIAWVFIVWPREDVVLTAKYMNIHCHVWARRCYELCVLLSAFAFVPSLFSLAFFRGDHKICASAVAICYP